MSEKQLSERDLELAKKIARKVIKNIPYKPYYDNYSDNVKIRKKGD